jgi:hypothetical protein
MRVLGCGLDVGVVEGFLHQLQVAGFPEQLGREVVPIMVETEV